MRIILLFVFTSTTFYVHAGGGWLQKKNRGYLKLNQYILIANQYYGPGGDIVALERKLSIFSTSLYAEYGITDRLNTVVYCPFFSRSVLNKLQRQNGTLDEGDELNGIGDTDIGFKYGIIQGKSTVVSATLTFGLALGDPAGGKSNTLQTGDGEYNQLLTVDISRSFYPAPLYAGLTVGFNNRTKGFSEEIRYGWEVGYSKNKFTALIRFAGIKSLKNSTINASTSAEGIFGNNIEYLTFTPEVIYSVSDKFGVSGSIGGALFGKQILANAGYSIGAYWNF